MAPLIPLCFEPSTYLFVYFLLIPLAIPTNKTFQNCSCVLYNCTYYKITYGIIDPYTPYSNANICITVFLNLLIYES